MKIGVVGGGAVGVEIAGDIMEDYKDKADVYLIHPRENLVNDEVNESFQSTIKAKLTSLGVNMVLGTLLAIKVVLCKLTIIYRYLVLLVVAIDIVTSSMTLWATSSISVEIKYLQASFPAFSIFPGYWIIFGWRTYYFIHFTHFKVNWEKLMTA